MQLSSLWINLSPLELTVYALKILLIGMCTYYTALKITDDTNSKKRIIPYVYILLISILSTIMKYKMSSLMVIASLIFLLSCIFAKTTYNNIGYSMIVTIISLGINYIIFFVAIIIAFFPSAVFAIDNNFWNLIIISFVQIIILQFVLRVNRIKYGISFLKSNIKSEYFDIFILNLSIGIIFLFTMFSDKEIFLSRNIFLGFIIFAIIMFITIQKSLQLYYKQKLLEKDLNETREELEKKTKEVEELEAEILSFSKKSHTLAHKQKSLEYKLQEIINKAEISKEEAKDIKERIKLLGKDLYEEKTIIELDKTGIIEIDDMLKCMQAECKKNKIDFEIQLKGNIHT